MIIIGGNDPFKENPEVRLKCNLDELAYPKRQFTPICDSQLLPQHLLDALIQVLSFEIPPKLHNVYPGRTSYMLFKDDQRAPLPGIKAKGAFGIEGDGRCDPPRPLVPYDGEAAVHMTLDQDLRLGIVKSGGRAHNTLSLDGAENEYANHEILAKHGLSFRPIVYGRFDRRDTKQPVLDYAGRLTGAVAVEWDPSWVPFSDVTNGLIYLFESQNERDKRFIVNYFLDATNQLGSNRYTAAIEAHIVRHAGHLGNFYFNQSTNELRMSDLDSCVRLEKLQEDKWGPQIVRDLGMDLVRLATFTLTFSSANEWILRRMENGDVNIFTPFIQGFFSKCRVPTAEIRSRTDAFQDKYLTVMRSFSTVSDYLFSQVEKHQKTGKGNIDLFDVKQGIAMLHTAMADHIFAFLADLVRTSDLSERGFYLPNIDSREQAHRLKPGIRDFLEAIDGDTRRRLKDVKGIPASVLSTHASIPRQLIDIRFGYAG